MIQNTASNIKNMARRKLSIEKIMLISARFISLVFSPFYLPLVTFLVLFLFSYMKTYPMGYKVIVLTFVWLFTIALPRFSIYLYRKINGWQRHQISHRHRRIVPYVLSITCYAALLYVMRQTHVPRPAVGVLIAALVMQVICGIINPWFKVSTHAAAVGGTIGMLLAYSQIFHFDPTSWLCFFILVGGMVCSSRIVLRQHTLGELGWGILIGFFGSFVSVIYA